GSGVEDQCHGPVVHEFERHTRPEPTGLDRNPVRPERLAERFIERLSLIGRLSLAETRSVPARPLPALLSSRWTCGVGDESELADDQRGTADVYQPAREPPARVLEDPEPGDLACEPLDCCGVVPARDPEQHDQPRANLPDGLVADGDARAGDPLADGTHRDASSSSAQPCCAALFSYTRV